MDVVYGGCKEGAGVWGIYAISTILTSGRHRAIHPRFAQIIQS